MGHLTSDELVDLAEGARAESSAPHLQTCATCRRKLTDLRELMSAAAAVEVPEPSPLFWDHLSARVRAAVASDEGERSVWWRRSTWPRVAVPALTGAFAVMVVGAMLTSRLLAPADTPISGPAAPPAPEAIVTESLDDPALNLVTELAAQMDWESASQLHVPTHQGAGDEAIGELSEPERREMRLLLQQELGRPGS